jgi:hypothetical protein
LDPETPVLEPFHRKQIKEMPIARGFTEIFETMYRRHANYRGDILDMVSFFSPFFPANTRAAPRALDVIESGSERERKEAVGEKGKRSAVPRIDLLPLISKSIHYFGNEDCPLVQCRAIQQHCPKQETRKQ